MNFPILIQELAELARRKSKENGTSIKLAAALVTESRPELCKKVYYAGLGRSRPKIKIRYGLRDDSSTANISQTQQRFKTLRQGELF